MRCPDCEKFVSFDEPQCDIEDENITDEGQISGSVHIVLPCGECGTELKETNLEFEAEIDHDCAEKGDAGFELTMDDPQPFDEYRGKDKKKKDGTVIKAPLRYQKHYYGAEISGTAKCNRCGIEIEFNTKVDEQGSAFDDMV